MLGLWMSCPVGKNSIWAMTIWSAVHVNSAGMRAAKVIILDEATSSVDPENEYLLVEAIEELGKNKTAISIAHRLSTVRKAHCSVALWHADTRSKSGQDHL